jgi:hypothetical protein
MGWADHEPPGGWDAPTPKQVSGGIEVGHMFFPWENFDVVPAEKLRRAERELAARQAQVKKLTPSPGEAAEAKRLARLEKLRRSTAASRKAPRWLGLPGGWSWHVWDEEKGGLVDTGLRPGKRGLGYPPDDLFER